MSAKSIFEQLQADGWKEVIRWKKDKEPESLHLDFKERGPGAGKLEDNDLSNVAKAMSAFANVDGGVLVLGVTAKGKGKDEPDRVTGIKCLQGTARIQAQLDRMTPRLTNPPVPGVRILEVADPAKAGSGVVAIYVPASDGGPHEVAFGSFVGRYFVRTSTNSIPAPQPILAALFGRRPAPKLRIKLRSNGDKSAYLFIANEGRGVAENVFVRCRVEAGGRDSLTHGNVDYPWHVRNAPLIDLVSEYWLAATTPDLIYPNGITRMTGFGAEPGEVIDMWARIDARDMQPIEIEARVTLQRDGFTDVPVNGDVTT